MTSRQPDKFFRDKLYNYQPPVSGDAWRRVSQNRHRKSRWSPFLKIAASVLLLATATVFLYPTSDNHGRSTSERNTMPPASEPPVAKPQQKEQIAENRTESPGEDRRATSPVEEPVAKDRSKPSVQKSVPQSPDRAEELSDISTVAMVPVDSTQRIADVRLSTRVPNDEKAVTATPPAERNNVTIVFTAEEVNQKYLTKPAAAEATSYNEEPSGLKKLLDKANDLKHNQDLLGNLRQKKNEILAMNFRSEKETTRND